MNDQRQLFLSKTENTKRKIYGVLNDFLKSDKRVTQLP